MNKKVKVGIVGTGMISSTYIAACRKFNILDLAACSDIDPSKAQLVAQKYVLPKACTVEEILRDPEIQVILNLTVPKAHAEISMAAIQAGKHVYSEKPLAATLEDGKRIIDAAREKNLLVGCAPDTFMGKGPQTCRKLLNEGAIGRPIASVAFFAARWTDSGNPQRDFLYQQGAGPMLDMGPYYITALVHLLGPVKRVTGSASMPFHERIAGPGEYQGRHIPVETPTHISGVLDFTSGAVGTVITSYDVHQEHGLPALEIYGSEGILRVPEPDYNNGSIQLYKPGHDWQTILPTHTDQPLRGVGLADMAYALTHNRPHRTSGDFAYHVLEVMTAFERASSCGRHIDIESRPPSPALFPEGLAEGYLDN